MDEEVDFEEVEKEEKVEEIWEVVEEVEEEDTDNANGADDETKAEDEDEKKKTCWTSCPSSAWFWSVHSSISI